jgi:hypothetical protein
MAVSMADKTAAGTTRFRAVAVVIGMSSGDVQDRNRLLAYPASDQEPLIESLTDVPPPLWSGQVRVVLGAPTTPDFAPG